MKLTAGSIQQNDFHGPHDLTFMCSVYVKKDDPAKGVVSFCDVFGSTEEELIERIKSILTLGTADGA